MRKIYQKGFTLIELMIVITVIAILAAIVLFGLGQAQKAARDVQRQSIIKGVQVAMQSFAGNNGGTYPTGATWGVVTNNSGPSTAVILGNTYLPDALTDPGCGRGTGGNMAGDANGIPGSGGCAAAGPPIYAYTIVVTGNCVGAPYQITLTKESGGVATFCGPK